MKSISRPLLALATMLCLASCIPSLHPPFTDEDTVVDEALAGEWSDEWEKGESASVWKFTTTGTGDYTLDYAEDGKTGKFKATLFKLGEHRYLDLFPHDPGKDDLSPLFKWHLLPMHTFLKVKQIEPELQMAFLDTNKLDAIVEADSKALAIQEISDRMVMTGSTEELQAFLKKYDKGDDLFVKFSEMTKKKN